MLAPLQLLAKMRFSASFLGPSSLSCGLFAIGALSAYTNDSYDVLSVDPLKTPYPYEFPQLQDANSTALFPMPLCGNVIIEEATIDQLQAYMSQGTLTAVKLAHCYWKRVMQTDDYIKYVSFLDLVVFSEMGKFIIISLILHIPLVFPVLADTPAPFNILPMNKFMT